MTYLQYVYIPSCDFCSREINPSRPFMELKTAYYGISWKLQLLARVPLPQEAVVFRIRSRELVICGGFSHIFGG